MAKVTYDDLFALTNEIEYGAANKSRTISSISNSKVKELVQSESNLAIKSGITACLVGATGAVVTSSLVGTVGGAGIGAVSTGMTTLGVTAMTGTGGALAGGTVGSAVPIVGTAIGLIVGAGIGVFVGKRIKKKNEDRRYLLAQKVISMQNTTIRDLEMELNELKDKYKEKVEENARYRYIIGVLMSNEELKQEYAA